MFVSVRGLEGAINQVRVRCLLRHSSVPEQRQSPAPIAEGREAASTAACTRRGTPPARVVSDFPALTWRVRGGAGACSGGRALCAHWLKSVMIAARGYGTCRGVAPQLRNMGWAGPAMGPAMCPARMLRVRHTHEEGLRLCVLAGGQGGDCALRGHPPELPAGSEATDESHTADSLRWHKTPLRTHRMSCLPRSCVESKADRNSSTGVCVKPLRQS